MCTALQMAATIYSSSFIYEINNNLFVNLFLILLKNKILSHFIPFFPISIYSPYLPTLCIVLHSVCSPYEFTGISANFFLINSMFNLNKSYVNLCMYYCEIYFNQQTVYCCVIVVSNKKI